MKQELCMFIPPVGEYQDSLAQVLEIKTLIYTSVTLAFPRQAKGIRKKQYNLGELCRSDPCRWHKGSKEAGWRQITKEAGL